MTTRRPGTRLSTGAVKLLFTPNDQTNHLAAIFYKAIPVLEELQEMRLMATDELVVRIGFRAMFHQSIGKHHKVGLLSDLTLT